MPPELEGAPAPPPDPPLPPAPEVFAPPSPPPADVTEEKIEFDPTAPLLPDGAPAPPARWHFVMGQAIQLQVATTPVQHLRY